MRTLILTALLFIILPKLAFGQVATNRDIGSTKKVITATASDGTVYSKTPEHLRREERKAIRYYRKGKYEKAYPMLSELAQWGLKIPQGLLGIMYLNGYHVDQSPGRGLAWLGVANEVDGGDFQEIFDEVYAQLSPEHQKVIDDKVAQYIQMYGVEAQNLRCRKHVAVGSHISEMICNKIAGSNSVLHPIE